MKNPEYLQLLEDLKWLHESKSHDYAVENNPFSNFEYAAEVAGITVHQVFSCMVGIKLARIQVLLGNKRPNNESVEDSFKDLSNYCLIWTSYYLKHGREMGEQEWQSTTETNSSEHTAAVTEIRRLNSWLWEKLQDLMKPVIDPSQDPSLEQLERCSQKTLAKLVFDLTTAIEQTFLSTTRLMETLTGGKKPDIPSRNVYHNSGQS